MYCFLETNIIRQDLTDDRNESTPTLRITTSRGLIGESGRSITVSESPQNINQITSPQKILPRGNSTGKNSNAKSIRVRIL